MQRYLIVIDLDGTMLPDFSTYDINTINYLRKLKEENHIIIIATGRPLRSSYFIYQAIGLDTPIVNYNGALISNPNDNNFPITDLRINRDSLSKILDYANGSLINAFCEIHDDIYVLDYNLEIRSFLHIDGGVMHIGPLQEILPDNPNGALLFVQNDMVEKLQKYVEDNFYDHLRSRYWSVGKYHIVEIYNKFVTKGHAVLSAMEYYNIDKDHTIVIGDGHNDIEMFQAAGISVAMANSHPDLFFYATDITTSVEEHGVLKFLKSFFESKKNDK